ncbi:MAG TPA: hypothetical protein VMV27_02860 [Candidatus Binataceae bacterium]|nr:hypothetical protein [Candidatus Binataceae bacterium]
MRLSHLIMLSLAGWYLVVAPAPNAIGKFDLGAPISKWNVRSRMFRTERDCESYRSRAASHGLEIAPNADQFVSDDGLGTPIVPKSASRCLDVGKPTIDLPG